MRTYFGPKINILFFVFLSIIICSCEKVISVDLNKTNPQIVIEGLVTDQSGPYSVLLSKSGNYFEPSLYFPPVSHADVTITDDLGSRDTLTETSSGTYRSSSLRGAAGRTYSLSVKSEGNEYSATSSMPHKVTIDSMYALPRREADGDRGFDLYVMFRDPPEAGNYYRLNLRVNIALAADSIDGRRYRLYSDKLTNGNEAAYRMRIRRNVTVGDTVTVDLLSIDKATYDYYKTLNDILTSDRSPTSLSPANPNTNLSNGALGHFAAYSVDTKTIVLR